MNAIRMLPAAEAEYAPTLAVTKLRPPRLHDALVPRARLTSQLSHAIHANQRLTLIAAPAGYGKTTLASQWLRENQDVVFAWLSLDTGDDAPDRFVDGLAAALALAGVNMPNPLEPAVLVNALAAFGWRLVIVLDDYHVISTPAIHAVLQAWMERLPDHVHLVLITRHYPALALGRLRAMGKLTELSADDLSFSLDETAALLNDVDGRGLSRDEIALLHAKTEGWAAGLHLAVLAIRQAPRDGRADVAGIIRHLGRQRFVQDYFREEVLCRQDEDMQRFLLQTALLNPLHDASCDALTGRIDSHAMLALLASANLFLRAHGDDLAHAGAAYHPLFAEFLRDQLRQSQRDRFCELEKRAIACQGESHHNGHAAAGAAALSEREQEVMRLMAEGLSNHEIAQRICVAPGTVKRHVHNIFNKLDARNRVEAIAHARHLHAGAQV